MFCLVIDYSLALECSCWCPTGNTILYIIYCASFFFFLTKHLSFMLKSPKRTDNHCWPPSVGVWSDDISLASHCCTTVLDLTAELEVSVAFVCIVLIWGKMLDVGWVSLILFTCYGVPWCWNKMSHGWHDRKSLENYFQRFVFDILTVLIWYIYYIGDIKLSDIISCFKRED